MAAAPPLRSSAPLSNWRGPAALRLLPRCSQPRRRAGLSLSLADHAISRGISSPPGAASFAQAQQHHFEGASFAAVDSRAPSCATPSVAARWQERWRSAPAAGRGAKLRERGRERVQSKRERARERESEGEGGGGARGERREMGCRE